MNIRSGLLVSIVVLKQTWRGLDSRDLLGIKRKPSRKIPARFHGVRLGVVVGIFDEYRFRAQFSAGCPHRLHDFQESLPRVAVRRGKPTGDSTLGRSRSMGHRHPVHPSAHRLAGRLEKETYLLAPAGFARVHPHIHRRGHTDFDAIVGKRRKINIGEGLWLPRRSDENAPTILAVKGAILRDLSLGKTSERAGVGNGALL